MSRPLFLLLLLVAIGVSDATAQTKKGASPGRNPNAKDPSILVNVYMRDPGKNELLVATRIFPGFPDYNAVALARYFAVMKAVEPPYVQDDDVGEPLDDRHRDQMRHLPRVVGGERERQHRCHRRLRGERRVQHRGAVGG